MAKVFERHIVKKGDKIMDILLRLSKAEIVHLLAHLEANGQKTGTDYDWYYGNREQFENRHKKLKQKLKMAWYEQEVEE